jgi:IS1 family transposase/transposase-like protein
MISPSTTVVEVLIMRCDPIDIFVVGVALIWLVVLSHWPCRGVKATPVVTKPPRAKRAPQPFAGFLHKPDCPLCEPAAELQPSASAPNAPPPRMLFTRGRPRHIETSGHCCPHATCAYHGWVGWGNIRANGHPNGRRWRQLVCLGCKRHFLETHDTPLHGKQVEPDKLVWAIAALAEGLGIRAVARVFETDPTTILVWLAEAAEHLEAFSRHFVHDLDVEQGQMDELFALLSAVKDGEGSEQQAIKRLSRSPHWVWVAMDPVCTLILAVDVGDRTLAMAQRLGHQVTQVLVPHCAPLFLTDGFGAYLTALVTPYGRWMQPERRQAKGPQPQPRWMPLPALLYAQVVKRDRRRRIVGVTHRVVFGLATTVGAILARRGWKINAAFIERLNLDFRQHVAAIGRRVTTLWKYEAGLRQQLTLFHTYHNFVLPHVSLRLALPELEVVPGTGAIKRWQPRTPAMAAGLTDRVGSVREVLMYRVPPWPQTQVE